jgi:Uma2 family endonuclease
MDIPLTPVREVEYPEDDGLPMSENTVQFRWIVTLQGGLDAVFLGRQDVFVAGDLLWYPVEGDNTIRTAPDTMVVLGRPPGDRGSYRQWEEDNIPPTVVFEVLSPGNRAGAMAEKLAFYDRYGVSEYYIYDPDHNRLIGYRRQGTVLVGIPHMNGWVSPLLNIRFDVSGPELQVYGPDGRRFANYREVIEQRNQAEQEAAENRQRADAAEVRAEAERQRAEQERLARETSQSENARLRERLRSLGIDPDAPAPG